VICLCGAHLCNLTWWFLLQFSFLKMTWFHSSLWLSKTIYIHIYIYIYVYICVYMYICVYIYIYKTCSLPIHQGRWIRAFTNKEK
jgi:hypothetical protein